MAAFHCGVVGGGGLAGLPRDFAQGCITWCVCVCVFQGSTSSRTGDNKLRLGQLLRLECVRSLHQD